MSKRTVQKQSESFYTRALVDVSSIVETENEKTFDVVFATENPVFRRGWEENFNEVLSCNIESMRLGRLEEKAVPLLDNDDRYTGVQKQMGTVIAYNVAKGECRATICFSTQEKFAGIWEDIKAGIIRSISTGYNVYKYMREVVTDNTIPNYRAVDWEPLEISLAPVPADFKSQIRSESEGHEILIENFSNVQNTRSTSMENNSTEVVKQTETTTQQRSSQDAQATTVTTTANETQIQ